MATNNSINTPLITLGGTLSTTGGNLSFGLSGNTNVALPTSGTLAQTTSIGLVKISSQSVGSVASVVFSSGISVYNTFMLLVTNCYPVTNGQPLILQLSSDGGSSYISTTYVSGVTYCSMAGTAFTSSNITSGMRLIPSFSSTTTNCPGTGVYYLTNMTNGTYPAMTGHISVYSTNSSVNVMGIAGGIQNTITTVNAFQIICGSGNIQQGIFTLYGVQE